MNKKRGRPPKRQTAHRREGLLLCQVLTDIDGHSHDDGADQFHGSSRDVEAEGHRHDKTVEAAAEHDAQHTAHHRPLAHQRFADDEGSQCDGHHAGAYVDVAALLVLSQQTAGKGVNIYTHSEMLPAHGYPGLNKYPHLAGNFGTAWQNQQKEFADLPAPILFTTNCIMPPRESYADRVYTTSVVGYKGLRHIEEDAQGRKDFSPIIEQALALGGYKTDRSMSGINGGHMLTTGFAHAAVLAQAPQIIEAIKSGTIKHIFLVGGCDGAHPGRNYYTEFVKPTPMDTLVLTLACGKFRFNDLDLGEINGIPRILDIGQCNDAYSAVQIALALADAFGCTVNDLPLTLVLSWYEQKAVCILLSLLSLGIKNIILGPTIPAFISPAVLEVLQKEFQLRAATTPEDDLKKILG